MKIVQRLQAMRTTLADPASWGKNFLIGPNAEGTAVTRCLLGARYMPFMTLADITADDGFPYSIEETDESADAAKDPAVIAIANVIREHFDDRLDLLLPSGKVIPRSERLPTRPNVTVTRFNDHPDTTHADVIQVLEKAIVNEGGSLL